MSPLNAIGIDPSLAATGVCYYAPSYAQPIGVTIETKATDPRRLNWIYNRITDICIDVSWSPIPSPDLAVIEDLPTHARSAGLTGQAQGVVRAALQGFGIPILTVPPASLKLFATGSGRASKADMQAAAHSTWLEDYGQGLPGSWDDNAVDAFWLREMGIHYLRHRGFREEDFGKANIAKWGKLKGVLAS